MNKGHFQNDEELFELFGQYGGILNWIDITCEGIIKMRLSNFGIKENDIKIIVDNAFTSGRMNNNPVDLSKTDVTEILLSIL
jgi:alcohol dehydrogenase class IV